MISRYTRSHHIDRTAPANPAGRPISQAAWKTIEAAILERVEVVELFLADLAGRFRFQSKLPESKHTLASVIEARRYLAGAQPSFQRRSWLSSMDIACDSEGQFWFVDDHYCCPFGLFRLKQLTEANAAEDAGAVFRLFTHRSPEQHSEILRLSTVRRRAGFEDV